MTLMREIKRRLIALELRRHRCLVQNAVDAVADAQFVFGRLKMNVRRAVLVSFPDDLVDELDDAGFLVAFGDFLVFADQQFERLVLGDFIEGFRAHAVVSFQRLFDLRLGRQRQTGPGNARRTRTACSRPVSNGLLTAISSVPFSKPIGRTVY